MQVIHVAGVPPNRGRTILANIGCTTNNSVELTNSVTEKSAGQPGSDRFQASHRTDHGTRGASHSWVGSRPGRAAPAPSMGPASSAMAAGPSLTRSGDEVRAPAAKRHGGPDELDDTEGPCVGQEAVGAREQAAKHEGEDETRSATFERVHGHHERESEHAEHGDHGSL